MSSILLYAEDLAVDKINKNSEIWVKPGHSVAIPICVDAAFTLISWEFTVHPKVLKLIILSYFYLIKEIYFCHPQFE